MLSAKMQSISTVNTERDEKYRKELRQEIKPMSLRLSTTENKLNDLINKQTSSVLRLNKLSSNVEQMGNSIQQLTKQMNDVKLLIAEEKKEDDGNDELKKQIQLLQQSVNVLMTASSSKASEQKQSEVSKWLKNVVKLPQYISLFDENGFDTLDVLNDIKPNNLEALGIQLMGHRMKIMREIAKLNQENVNKPAAQYEGSTAYI